MEAMGFPSTGTIIINNNYYTVIEKDHLGDWSPEKDCC